MSLSLVKGGCSAAEQPAAEQPPRETVTAAQLRLFIERIERLHEERKGLADDLKDVWSEAKGQGFDKAAMRQILRLRSMETHTRQEWDALVETYREALGL